jgi:hypothetical protein
MTDYKQHTTASVIKPSLFREPYHNKRNLKINFFRFHLTMVTAKASFPLIAKQILKPLKTITLAISGNEPKSKSLHGPTRMREH